jgi:hypothetical protein
MSVGSLSAPTGGVTATSAGAGAGTATTPGPAPASAPIADASSQVATPAASASALGAMLGEAAARQDSLAPLLANLTVAAASPNLPDAVRATVGQLLAVLIPLDGEATGDALRLAAQTSGLFLEAGLAAGLLSPGQEMPGPGQDLKALLLTLTAGLQDADESETAAAARTLVATSAERPQPPVAGGQTAGQAPAPATLNTQAPPDAMVRALQQQAQAALARVELSQAASLPKPGEAQRWVFEAPVATPAGTGVAQFEINRDGGGGQGGGAGSAPAWRARFSVDTAPGGPVHAAIVLSGGRLRVTLMAENEPTRAALAGGQDELARALAREDGGDVAIRVLGGAPAPAAPPPGQFVDRQS